MSGVADAVPAEPFTVSVSPWRDGTHIFLEVGPHHQVLWHDYSVRDFGAAGATRYAEEAAEGLRRVLRELVDAARESSPGYAGDEALLAGLLRLAGWRSPDDAAGGWEPPSGGTLRYGLRDAAARALGTK